jgi:uncharacterized protein (TIGR00730 family)
MENNKPLTLAEISEATHKRLALISEEFKNGFDFINNYPRSVTFFGSARAKEDEVYYNKARDLAARIAAELHYSVMTGGGPGIMEAVNRGAYEAGGNSLGLTISLPKEQVDNSYLTDKEDFHYFFSRKVCLAFSAEAYVFFPGGFGTLDEFLEILTLVQTGKIPKAPIILVGTDFWTPLQNFFREILLKNKKIDEEDLSLYTITENEDEIIKIIKSAPVRFGLKYNQNLEKSTGKNLTRDEHGPLSGLFKKIGW